jgi:hypothetical protein
LPSSLCTTHFVSNCPICDPQSTTSISPVPLLSHPSVPPEVVRLPDPEPELEPEPSLSDPQAIAVMSAAEKYTQACEAVNIFRKKRDELRAAEEEAQKLYEKAVINKRQYEAELLETLRNKPN